MTALFKKDKVYWIAICITAALCYGFSLTHFSLGVDDEAFDSYFSNVGLLSQGRWGYIPLRKLFNSYSFLPFWRDIIGLILMVIGLCIITGLFRKVSKEKFNYKAETIFSCIVLSFPFFAYLFIFMMTTIELGCVLILVGLALYFCFSHILLEKSLFYYIGSFFLLGYAISFAETAAVFFLCAGFITLFLYQIGSKAKALDVKSLLIAILKFIIAIVAALILWKAGAVVLQKYYNCPSSNYVSRMVLYDTSDISSLLKGFLAFALEYPKHLVNMSLSDNFAFKMIFISTLLLFSLSALFAVKMRRFSVFFIGFMAMFSPHALLFLTGNIGLPLRSLVAFSFLVAFSLSLAYLLLKKFNYKGFKFEWVVVFSVILVLFYQSKQMNECFYIDYQKYQYDLAKMNALVYDLEKNGYEDKPIVFVGLIDEFKYAKGGGVGNTIFNWDRSAALKYELESKRIFAFFKRHGYELEKYQGDLNPDILKLEIEGMENWPANGSIKECEEYVIVKLGWSRLE